MKIFRPSQPPLWLEQVLQSIERGVRTLEAWVAAYVFGYSTGDGGTVTQGTSKATAVTLNTKTGQITMNAAALAAATIVSFTLNDTEIAATDQIVVTHHSGGTIGAYTLNGRATGAGTAQITVRNNTAGSLSEALVLKFSIIKSVTS